MLPMQVLTLSTPTTLPQARVLARSLRRRQPDWPHEILVITGGPVTNDSQACPRVRPIASELAIDIETLIARHDLPELTALLLPRLLRRRLERAGGPLLHLPPTVWVRGNLEPIANGLSENSVLLVPRTIADVPDDGLEPTPEQLESAGRVSETIIGVDGTSRARGFLSWWSERVEEALGSLDAPRDDPRSGDRRPWLARFLELAPARFSTAVLDDPGCNLSFWNLNVRQLERGPDGVRVNGRWPLRFLDLPGFDSDRPYCLNARANRVRLSRSPVLRELCAQYAGELERADVHRRDVGRKLTNGPVYDEVMHSLRRTAEDLGERFDDLFSATGSRSFLGWLGGGAPVGRELGLTRYLYYRLVRERPDVMRAYPHLDGTDRAGFVGWCWTFGRHQMGIPDRFMPPRPGAAAPGGSHIENDLGGNGDRGSHDAGGRSEHASRPGEGKSSETHRDRDEHLDSTRTAKPSEPAARVSGYLSRALGLGAAARGYAQALEAAGVAVSTTNVPLHHVALPDGLAAGYGEHGFEDVPRCRPRSNFELLAINADELPDFIQRMGSDYFRGPRIGIWGWETNSIPRRWKRAFEMIDEIWVYSRFMAENIGVVAPVPVIALPPPVQPPADPQRAMRLDVPDGTFMFLFVFDYLSTIQRKNPVGLIEAFTQAFAPGEGPHLLIKTINGPLRPLAEEEVLWAAHGRPDVHVVDRSLSVHERDGLMAGCDCYVSLHRSEGFGLTLAEAMAIGKPVIGTGYSGNLDFMTAQNSYLVDYELSVVGPDCEIYPADGEWAQPNVEHAARLMREVVADPQHAAALGMQARDDVARLLSPRTTGAAMRKRLEQLAQGVAEPGRERDGGTAHRGARRSR
jgi:glycosyltransferase involved in cell wall biosynthesis